CRDALRASSFFNDGHSDRSSSRESTMSDILNLIARILLSAVFIVYGYLAFADINAWLNFNQAALKRFFDLVGGGLAPPTWFGYLIATIQLFGGLAILIGVKTRWVAYALVLYIALVVYFAHNLSSVKNSEAIEWAE